MMKPNKEFDLSVSDPGSTSVIKVDDRRSLQQYRKDMITTFADFIMNSAVVPKNASEGDKKSLAIAGAILKAEYGLCVVAQEAYFIALGKDKKKYSLDISYRGLTKKRREYERETGDTLIQGEGIYMSQDGIEKLGLDICRRCGGKGEYTYEGKKNKCWNCFGNGRFDSSKVLHFQIKYYSKKDALAAKEIGVDYFPIIGSALWQPCDTVPSNKTPQWVVEKNAYKDAIRRLVPVTDFANSGSPLSMESGIEDASTEAVAELCVQYGVACDDIYSLSGFTRNCVFVADWDSEETVIAALAILGIKWELSKVDETKYRVFGYRDGEYPILSTGALDSDEPPGGILVKNVMLDVGGIERANEISEKLFEKSFSKALTRAQLKQIHESATENGQ